MEIALTVPDSGTAPEPLTLLDLAELEQLTALVEHGHGLADLLACKTAGLSSGSIFAALYLRPLIYQRKLGRRSFKIDGNPRWSIRVEQRSFRSRPRRGRQS
jgi:hypothetical protein